MTTTTRVNFKTLLMIEVEVTAEIHRSPETRLDPPEEVIELTSIGAPTPRGRWVDLMEVISDRAWQELQEEALSYET